MPDVSARGIPTARARGDSPLMAGAAGLPLRWSDWAHQAKTWTLMDRGAVLVGFVSCVAFVFWRLWAARRERARLEALVASRTRQFQQSEALFRSMFEHATEGIFQSSLDGRNLRANPAMTRICGFDTPEEMHLGYTEAATQFYVQPGRRAQINAEVARQGGAVECESEIRRRDGSTIWISENVRTVVDPATGKTVYQGSIVDITARRELQAAQEQARAAAEAANAAKSAFLAHMTHELRTPLTGILSSARVALRDPALDEKNQARYSLIAASGEHLLRLVEEVLDLSRIEAGRMELHPGPFNLAVLLRAVSEGFQPRAAEKRLEFRCEIDPSLPLNVHGDAVRLRQVLDNLLGNAFKFTDCGRIALGVRSGGAAAGEAVQRLLTFEVLDTGIGIAPDQLAAIFQPFHQALTPGRSGATGAGLGLNISRRLVALMGGNLQVASTPDQGSRFFFDVPLPEATGAGVPPAGDPEDPALRTVIVHPATVPVPLVLPPTDELQALNALSLGGDIVRLRARLEALAAADPAYADFARELDRLAAGFRMNAISEFLGRASRSALPSSNGERADDFQP